MRRTVPRLVHTLSLRMLFVAIQRAGGARRRIPTGRVKFGASSIPTELCECLVATDVHSARAKESSRLSRRLG
ncbi:hypothetical protein EDB89DRAFT_1921552 [Lactarius sanguifluus]|nr:hypothetical protein EDB89DRAFT_1921552 [Lactarius sanguifluus]